MWKLSYQLQFCSWIADRVLALYFFEQRHFVDVIIEIYAIEISKNSPIFTKILGRLYGSLKERIKIQLEINARYISLNIFWFSFHISSFTCHSVFPVSIGFVSFSHNSLPYLMLYMFILYLFNMKSFYISTIVCHNIINFNCSERASSSQSLFANCYLQ